MAASSSAFFDLLSRQQPQFRTRKALLVLGLQDEDAAASSIPDRSFVRRILTLVPAFRRNGGDVYWLRVTGQRSTKDNAATATTTDPQAGAENDQLAEVQIAGDTHITAPSLSAFNGTCLLTTLRMRLATEVYLTGCMTDLAIQSTAVDAAQHGMSLNIVEDCVGYTSLDNHIRAMQYMSEDLGAYTTTCSTLLERFGESLETDDSATWVDAASSPAPDLDDQSLIFSVPTNDTDGVPSDREFLQPDSGAEVRTVRSSWSFAGQDDMLGIESLKSTETVSPSEGPIGALERLAPEVAPSSQSLDPRVPDLPVFPSTQTAAAEGQSHPVDRNVRAEISPQHMQLPQNDKGRKRRSTDLEDGYSNVKGLKADQQQLPTRPNVNKKSRVTESLATFQGKAPSDKIGCGDTYIRYDLLPSSKADETFGRILSEVHWQSMSHATGTVPRLVCCQGTTDRKTGAMPVYRHPSDHTLPLLHWTPAVSEARKAAENVIGHPLNHVLIQLYRGGSDHISEHSDKTLDIVPGSSIVNVSFGAQRTMRLRTKRVKQTVDPLQSPTVMQDMASSAWFEPDRLEMPAPERITERVPMPHNSIFVLGQKTNASFLHGIQPDRRLPHDLSPVETAFGGYRISLTFRQIGTFISHDSSTIWGQGATSKSAETPMACINGDLTKSQELINAFGAENQATNFDWTSIYGQGFDVLHIRALPSPKEYTLVFLSGDSVQDETILLYLQHLEEPAELIVAPQLALPSANAIVNADGDSMTLPRTARPVCLRDVDRHHTQVTGLDACLLYLERTHSPSTTEPAQLARQLELLSGTTLPLIRSALASTSRSDTQTALSSLESELHTTANPVESETCFLAGVVFGVADCALYPLARRLKALVGEDWLCERCPRVRAWCERVSALLREDMDL